jgi:hypothetical protein
MPLTRIKSLGITDGTIVNADINASAAIAGTKLTGVGKVLQVIEASDGTARSTTSTSFVTGSNTLSVSITPSSSANKVLILVNMSYSYSTARAEFTIFRDATNLAPVRDLVANHSGGTEMPVSYSFLDSPSSTSAITYQVYFRSSNGNSVSAISNSSRATITCFEIAG